jgi:hypothetical protein
MMSSCCPPSDHHDHDHPKKQKIDFLLWGALILSLTGYAIGIFFPSMPHAESWWIDYGHSVFENLNHMWLGLGLGILAVGILGQIPRDTIMRILGRPHSNMGLMRATLAGVILDMCNHGILMVAMRLYKHGASLGQVMAFLIASPWNSLSLTLILLSLIGLKWTVCFIILSMLIALISGKIFDVLEQNGTLPKNPNLYISLRHSVPDMESHDNKKMLDQVQHDDGNAGLGQKRNKAALIKTILYDGIAESKSVFKWVFVGVVMAGMMHGIFKTDQIQNFFAPTMMGLLLTTILATIIEVCSEGSVPIAADILKTAGAAGNSFTFLMAGVSTDYTEIMAIKDATQSWKIALFLPLITLPQVLLIGLILNLAS